MLPASVAIPERNFFLDPGIRSFINCGGKERNGGRSGATHYHSHTHNWNFSGGLNKVMSDPALRWKFENVIENKMRNAVG